MNKSMIWKIVLLGFGFLFAVSLFLLTLNISQKYNRFGTLILVNEGNRLYETILEAEGEEKGFIAGTTLGLYEFALQENLSVHHRMVVEHNKSVIEELTQEELEDGSADNQNDGQGEQSQNSGNGDSEQEQEQQPERAQQEGSSPQPEQPGNQNQQNGQSGAQQSQTLSQNQRKQLEQYQQLLQQQQQQNQRYFSPVPSLIQDQPTGLMEQLLGGQLNQKLPNTDGQKDW